MKLHFKTITLLFLIAICTACNNNDTCISGEGTITTQILEVSEFNKIDSSVADISITQGETQKVKVTGHPNIIAELKASVSNNILEIDLESGCYSDYQLNIEITIPEISLINITGSGEIIINDFNNQSTLEASITGSGQITLNEFEGITNLNVAISGSGLFEANHHITILNNVTIDISGSGDYNGYEINSDNVIAKISGSGKAYVTAIETLDTSISGSGKIYYKGTPVITKSISGSGNLIDTN